MARQENSKKFRQSLLQKRELSALRHRITLRRMLARPMYIRSVSPKQMQQDLTLTALFILTQYLLATTETEH